MITLQTWQSRNCSIWPVRPERDINVYINSPGGVVYSGLAIYDTMQFVTCPVATICVGLSASMGSVLLASGTKGSRASLPNSRIMLHQPSGGSRGTAADIEIQVNEILHLKKRLYEILADHTGKTVEQLEADSERDYWLSAQQAKDYGIIDNVLIPKEKGALRKTAKNNTAFDVPVLVTRNINLPD